MVGCHAGLGLLAGVKVGVLGDLAAAEWAGGLLGGETRLGEVGRG